ncbi:YopX family protein [Lacticaseibacillus paracasei]|nr:MAG TPA: YopX protein [Caudoviricetes sp.]
MKREIKFRVWDHNTDTMMIPDDFEFCDGEISWIDAGREAGPKSGNDGDPGQFEIMQYIGLHDKNGRSIYEGDIVSFGSVWNNGDNEDIDEEFHIGVVEYDPHYAVYSVNCEESGERRFLFTDVVNYDGFGVIGNIFENTEMLEEEQ